MELAESGMIAATKPRLPRCFRRATLRPRIPLPHTCATQHAGWVDDRMPAR
jgi:hypothetical protein